MSEDDPFQDQFKTKSRPSQIKSKPMQDEFKAMQGRCKSKINIKIRAARARDGEVDEGARWVASEV